ncbi:MAG TPA: acyl-CoA dehydrogenase family protein [Alphaproteobacteria bacterium]|jgi:citronellyl-CoA dehydrogenase|nr:acyl-CoA dehydrogenase family protein [Alphaproteobacteria bacterium]MDP6269211.1 acyl-CoA dehydrogenase family protein [Alphaproteobacteria bacterium]MDP7163827.1 acyl-CoA dehydrogenase family protein [Alphaproteobacteria bacterium]MDP7428085.1 acyl-CoA dehydrogenase family protein [Alphaproteobacteria bacterium]HJM49049.1 acyl-CoA dehydrogenase family protein [Alphaproteobacteria bacterium]|tara:strand:- start:565 stop:1728 length:1164 start_codon:yes stop_codon:yes gene_type:complete
MQFTQEHDEIRRTVRRLIDNEVNPHVEEWEDAELFPAHEVFKKFGDAGLLGIHKPVEYGGMGLDYSYNMAMAEELGHVSCGAIPMAIGVQTDMCSPALARFGSKELCEEFLAPNIAGDAVGCIGVTEPSAGSDVANIRTKAEKDGDDYVINGGKIFITNGCQADWVCLLANTSAEGGPHKNKSLIMVPMKTPGVTVARKLRKMGMQASDTAEIHFDDVRVPQRNRVGDENAGFIYQMLQFQEERMWASISVLKSMEEVIEETADYTRNRQVFGGPLLDNQAVHFRLAELTCEVEALRSLIYRAIESYIGGKDATRLASMAKLKGGKLVREVADWCVQFHGGTGYMWETRVNRFYRDARLMGIGGGADEVMMAIIAKFEGTLPGKGNR